MLTEYRPIEEQLYHAEVLPSLHSLSFHSLSLLFRAFLTSFPRRLNMRSRRKRLSRKRGRTPTTRSGTSPSCPCSSSSWWVCGKPWVWGSSLTTRSWFKKEREEKEKEKLLCSFSFLYLEKMCTFPLLFPPISKGYRGWKATVDDIDVMCASEDRVCTLLCF